MAIELLNSSSLRHGKRCKRCYNVLPLYRFRQDNQKRHGLSLNKCTKCNSKSRCQYSKMYNGAKKRNIKKFGIQPDFDVDYIKKLFVIQKGRCAISNHVMTEEYGTGKPFNMSIERLENSIGYCKSNIVLVCVCFQVGYGYDIKPALWRELLMYNMENDDFVFNKDEFIDSTKLIKLQRRKPVSSQPKRNINGNIISQICTECGIRKEINEFYKRKEEWSFESKCKQCTNSIKRNRRNSVRGFIKGLINSAISHCKHRNSIKNRPDDDHIVDHDIFDIVVELFVEQKGRCCLTNIPFKFNTNHLHAPSLDRLDNTKGYIRGNIRIIISPLNTVFSLSKDDFEKVRKSLTDVT